MYLFDRVIHCTQQLSMSFLNPSNFASSSRSALRCLVRPTPVPAALRSVRSASSRSPTKPSLNVASASGGPQDPLAYCSSLVQRLDPEAWLTSYFWKGRERAWFLAWRAFNVGSLPLHDLIYGSLMIVGITSHNDDCDPTSPGCY